MQGLIRGTIGQPESTRRTEQSVKMERKGRKDEHDIVKYLAAERQFSCNRTKVVSLSFVLHVL